MTAIRFRISMGERSFHRSEGEGYTPSVRVAARPGRWVPYAILSAVALPIASAAPHEGRRRDPDGLAVPYLDDRYESVDDAALRAIDGGEIRPG
jgi:hypothetical protein